MTAPLPQPQPGSDWTTETLRQFMVEALSVRDANEAERNLARDRHDAERDRRYQERWEAQSRAVESAFLAQQIAMQAALSSAKEAAAVLAVATNQRLEAMNEFRGTVNDVLAGAMPRSEAEARLNSILEKLSDANQRAEEARAAIVASVASVEARIAGSEQRGVGHESSQSGTLRLIMMIVAVVGVIISIYLATR